MLKRIVSLFLITLILVLPFSITASASSAEPIGWILEALQAIDYINNLNENVRDMSGDEFYDFITNQDSFDSAAWTALLATLGQPASFQLSENLDNMHAAKYNAVKVQQDSIRNIYNQATKINTSNLRYFSFEDLGLSTYQDISCSITYTGHSCLPDVGTAWNKNNLDGKFTLNTGSFGSAVRFYNGSSMAFPVIYVPANTSFYQNGVLLPNINATWWVPLGSDTLLQILGGSYIQPYTISGDALNDLTFGIYNSVRKENLSIYKNGVEVGQINTDEYSGWEVADLLSKMVGFCITTDGDPNAGVIAPPSDIPYDDDGYVYVCIPEDKSDVVYLSPTTYNDYVNNGLIVEGDYVSNVTDETVNNITNNITNIYEGSSYDDTNLINKLEGWFDDLSDKLSDIKDKLNLILLSITFDNIIDTIGDLLGYDDFDKDKFDLDWKTLIQSKLPILAEVEVLVLKLVDTNSPLVLEAENPLNWLLGSVPDEERLPNFKIDFDWFTEIEYKGLSGREYVRKGLSIIVYVVFFGALYRKTDSIFHSL